MPNTGLEELVVKVGKGPKRKLVESGPAMLDEKVLGASYGKWLFGVVFSYC